MRSPSRLFQNGRRLDFWTVAYMGIFIFSTIWLIYNQEARLIGITENSLFVYRVYLDRRGAVPKLRVLSFNGCHNDSVLFAEIHNEWKPLKPIPMYNTCPETLAWGCLLVAYFHDVELEGNLTKNEIAIRGPSETRMVPVHVAEAAKELGITVCIAPMFWYTDWTKLIFFIEWWKAQKAEEIMVYVHSTSAEVKEVLNFYEKKGWITLIPWPMMPSSKKFQPNDEVYRLGQILAHNDCILRAKTEFATAVDLDEILHSTNEPLIDYTIKGFRNKSIGSLTFTHHSAIFESPLFPEPYSFEKVDYKGVLKMYHRKFELRRPKVIVRTDAVDRMAVHGVAAFRNKEINETANDAFLLHIRYSTNVGFFINNFVNKTANNSSSFYYTSPLETTEIVKDPLWFQLNLLGKTGSIFPQGASFHRNTQAVLGKCTDSWTETQGQCKAPVTYCRKVVENLENWVEETTNAFTVL